MNYIIEVLNLDDKSILYKGDLELNKKFGFNLDIK